MHAIKLDQFEGPLDLLLELVEQQKMEITNVALAQVTEQFLDYLAHAQSMHVEELADFLVVAAKLLLIKSRVLLPHLTGGDEEEIDLEKQLKLYREYYEASKRVHALILQRRYSFSRGVSLKILLSERRFRPPERLAADDLARFFRVVLKRLEPFLSIPEEVITRTINIRQTISAIRERIMREATLNFQSLLASAASRTEIIVTFLALLELVKQRAVAVVQHDTFSQIEIQRRAEPASVNDDL
ncbi:MAG: segregation/condensation protein A [Candidatus Kerfeldbacteria bacterium]|nr:segregation/condensation protein A [Candidatus Kerfeldbacteria bacterium]